MNRTTNTRLLQLLSTASIACGLALIATPAFADDDHDDGTCSNRTVKGDYAFTIEGFVLPGGGAMLPIRGVHMTHFNGRGSLTQVDHIIANGSPVSPLEWTPVTGTYHINPDCTGTISLISPPSHFTNLKIVVARNGRRIFTVVTTPFDGPPRTVTSTGVKVE